MKPVYLRTAREKLGLTQAQLQERSGVPQSHISRLENSSERRPNFEWVIALADALGIDPRALRFGPDPKKQRERVVA
jgi:transcriptional regulator with XRE-family HTH domain